MEPDSGSNVYITTALTPRERRIRLGQAVLAAVALGSLAGGSIGSLAYTKDIHVEYVTAWAIREGIDVFTPPSVLSTRYFPRTIDYFPYVSHHPPFLAALFLPLTVLPFPAVVLLWLGLNIWLLIPVGRWLGLSVPGSLALAAWPPLWCLLYIGQYELIMLALAMLGWRAARTGQDWWAGVWLGAAAVGKLYPALLLVPFLARGRWRIVAAAGAVLALSQVGNLAVVGLSGLVRYYTEVMPGTLGHYVGTAMNSSPYGALLRLLGGSSPLVEAPGMILPVSIGLAVIGMLALVALEPEAAPVGILITLPTAWFSYVVLALPQIVVLLRSPRLRRPAVAIVLAASFVLPLTSLLILQVVRWIPVSQTLVALLLTIQPIGFVGLAVLSLVLSLTQSRYGCAAFTVQR